MPYCMTFPKDCIFDEVPTPFITPPRSTDNSEYTQVVAGPGSVGAMRDVKVTRPNQLWAVGITYLPMALGFLYLVAVKDWPSRYIASWRLSNTLEAGFCAEAL